MVIGEGEDGLFALLADQTSKIFKAVGAGFERLGAGVIDCASRMLLYKVAQAHNRAQRLDSSCVKGPLSPLTAFFAKNPGSADPIAARTKHWSVQAADPQDTAKATWLNSGMDLDLFHPLVENSDAATIPADPDLVANELGGYFVEGAGHFDVTVAVDVAPSFLVGGKKRVWQWLKVGTFLLKTGHDLFAGRAMDPLVGDTAFPVTKKEVFFTQRLEASSLQSIGAHVSDPALHFPFVLRRPGTTRNDMQAVVATKVSQLRIDFRIKPVGLEHSGFKVVQIQQQGHPAKAAQPVFQTPQKVSVSWRLTASL